MNGGIFIAFLLGLGGLFMVEDAIVSDSASYNPNVGSRVQWQSMQRIP